MTEGRPAESRIDTAEGGAMLALIFGGVLTFGLTLSVGLALLGIGMSDRRVVAGGPDGGVAVSALMGERVYASTCVTCHGPNGEGGVGPQLAGVVAEIYPDIADQIAVVTNGKGGMPPFGNQLTPAEIEAVVIYERTELGRRT